MTRDLDRGICDFCKKGRVATRDVEMGFNQWTARGYVYCKVLVPLGVCDRCGMRSWDEAAEAIFEEAVRTACLQNPPDEKTP